MAAGVVSAEFQSWLNTKLRDLNTDENIFGSYIVGILEGDENSDEKQEALEGVLSEMLDNNLSTIVCEILEKWNTCHPKDEKTSQKRSIEDVDAQLARILETQKLQTTAQRHYTPEELRIREQILAQYSQLSVSDEEGDGSVGEENATAGSSGGLVKNTNAQDVAQIAKERREQAKIDSQKKKEKDKEDREKQKQLREEKKEKRKTVKGERRR